MLSPNVSIQEKKSLACVDSSAASNSSDGLWDGLWDAETKSTSSPTSTFVIPTINMRACDLRSVLWYLTHSPVFGLSDYLWGYIRLEVPSRDFLAAVVSLFHECAIVAGDTPNEHQHAHAQRLAWRVLYWLRHCWRPTSDSPLVEDLRSFILDDVSPLFPELSILLISALESARKNPPVIHSHTLHILHSLDPDLLPPPRHRFVKHDPYLSDLATPGGTLEFARQLTLAMSDAFREIEPWELVRAWNRHVSARVTAYPERHYLELVLGLKRWVETSVCDASDARTMMKLYTLWREVAEHCYEMRNFDAAYQIAESLNTPSVHLRRSEAPRHGNRILGVAKRIIRRFNLRQPSKVSPADGAFWEDVSTLQSFRYKAMLGQETHPTIPCLLLHFDHVARRSSTLDNVPIFHAMDDSLIFSLDALQAMAEDTYELERMHKPYPFVRNWHMQRWILKTLRKA